VANVRLDDQRRLAQFAAAVESGGIPSVKAAANAAGLRAGLPRAPLAPASEDEAARISETVAAYRAS
jgi:dihydrodipicolinate synthase/N-acetylneuraminate lyase